MDVLTQGIIGAAAGHLVAGHRLPRAAWVIGAAAGFAPDLDVFLRSALDPRPWMVHHRGFSHSLLFIPIGALLVALPFLAAACLRREGAWRWTLLASLAGIATHGPLDALTSYGTQLWLPFSDARTSLDLIGIIDPIFSLPLLAGVVWGVWRGRRAPTAWALGLVVAYAVAGGGVQHWRAAAAQRELAAARGQEIARGRVMPAPLSLLLWRSVYETTDGRIVVDRVRTPWMGEATVRVGDGVGLPAVRGAERALSADDAAHEPTRDTFEVFAWFADGYVVEDPARAGRFLDARYGASEDPAEAFWGVELPATPPDEGGVGAGASDDDPRLVEDVNLPRLSWWRGTTSGDFASRLWKAMRGRDPLDLPLDEIN